jgi:hypothetical protein
MTEAGGRRNSVRINIDNNDVTEAGANFNFANFV